MTRLFHIALRGDWEQARQTGSYRVSTLGRGLDEVGYIHLSFAHQVKTVADTWYRDAGDLLLLELDPDRLRAPVRVEAADTAASGTAERFPHLYGEITPDAVIAADRFVAGPDGFNGPFE